MYCINEKYYFNKKGKKIIPTVDQIRKYYDLDNKIVISMAGFPDRGYAVRACSIKPFDYPYNSRAEAERAREKRIQEVAQEKIEIAKKHFND